MKMKKQLLALLLAAAMVVGIWQPALLQQLIDQIVSL